MKTTIRNLAIIQALLISAAVYAGPTPRAEAKRTAARAEEVRKWCIRETTLNPARIKVKHLGNNRYGVFLARMKKFRADDSGITITHSFDGVTKPEFCLVYNEATKKWSIPEEDEFAVSLWRKED